MNTEKDSLKIRCPRLGHEIPFSYCRKPGEDLPCFKIFDCWWQVFDIRVFMEENYPEHDRQRKKAPPKMKPISLLEVIQKVEKGINE